eukprot:9479231-Pyramimonas_sp.AAC.1
MVLKDRLLPLRGYALSSPVINWSQCLQRLMPPSVGSPTDHPPERAAGYAAMLGATTEFTKMEGLTYDKVRNEIYLSLSTVWKSMEDKKEA